MALGPANPGAAPRPESGQAQVRNLFPTPVAILAGAAAARPGGEYLTAPCPANGPAAVFWP